MARDIAGSPGFYVRKRITFRLIMTWNDPHLFSE